MKKFTIFLWVVIIVILLNSCRLFRAHDVSSVKYEPTSEPTTIVATSLGAETPMTVDMTATPLINLPNEGDYPNSTGEEVTKEATQFIETTPTITSPNIHQEITPTLTVAAPNISNTEHNGIMGTCDSLPSNELKGEILFWADWNDNENIFALDLLAEDIQQITQHTFQSVHYAEWRPNSDEIIYRSTEEGENDVTEIYLLNIESKEELLIATSNQRPLSWFSWSADNNQLALHTIDGVFIYDLSINDGFILNEIKMGSERSPLFSPTQNNKVGYLVAMDSRQTRWRIFVTDTISHETKLIETNSFSDDQFIWHPDGERILFSSFYLDNPNIDQIYLTNNTLTNYQQITSSPGLKSQLSISPNGKLLAYTSTIWTFDAETEYFRIDEHRIEIVDLENFESHQIVYHSSNLIESFVWSPSSNYLAFSERSDDDIYAELKVINICTLNVETLIEEIPIHQNLDWR